MPKEAVKRYTKPCRHVHLSGRKCAQRVGRAPLTGQFPDPALCPLHVVGCAECVAMAQAFPKPDGTLVLPKQEV